MFDIHQIFNSSGFPATAAAQSGWSPKALFSLVTGFYRRRSAWVALVVSTLILVYGGGALMFWYHSIYLGEGGPAISPLLHWFIDSSAGLIPLTPAIAVILPIAARSAVKYPGQAGMITTFAMMGGTLMAFATVPGPVMHDKLVGRGTWVANELTKMWGDGRPLSPPHHYPVAMDMSLQLAFALPVYIILMGATLMLIRQVAALSRQSVMLQDAEPELSLSQD